MNTAHPPMWYRKGIWAIVLLGYALGLLYVNIVGTWEPCGVSVRHGWPFTYMRRAPTYVPTEPSVFTDDMDARLSDLRPFDNALVMEFSIGRLLEDVGIGLMGGALLIALGRRAIARRFQFTIAQLLIAMAFIAMFISYAANCGIGFAIVQGTLALIAYFLLIHAYIRWHSLSLRRRLDRILIGTLCLTIMAVCIADATFVDPSLDPLRRAWHLQQFLNADNRFCLIRTEYVELKVKFLRIEGQVDSDRDLASLHEAVSRYWQDTEEVSWHVDVCSPVDEHDK